MRFVPFVGGIIAAFFPILLAAAVDPGWTMVLATAGLFLVAEPIAAFGSDAQKQSWLRKLASGESLGAFALSEEQAGSDAASISSAAFSPL